MAAWTLHGHPSINELIERFRDRVVESVARLGLDPGQGEGAAGEEAQGEIQRSSRRTPLDSQNESAKISNAVRDAARHAHDPSARH